MRLVYVQGGELSIRWTWLPCWLALNPVTKHTVARELQDITLLGGVTTSEADLDALSRWVRYRFQQLFPAFPGLESYLAALGSIQPAEEPPGT
jgi:hypothetical protein